MILCPLRTLKLPCKFEIEYKFEPGIKQIKLFGDKSCYIYIWTVVDELEQCKTKPQHVLVSYNPLFCSLPVQCISVYSSYMIKYTGFWKV